MKTRFVQDALDELTRAAAQPVALTFNLELQGGGAMAGTALSGTATITGGATLQ